MKETFLYAYLWLKVIHKKEPAISSIQQSYFLPNFHCKKKYYANVKDTIDQLPCLNNQIIVPF